MSMSVNWFKLNRSLHRDIGYFCIGMTLIFAVSGIAVNHVEDWNPNYDVTQETVTLNGLSDRIEQPGFEQKEFEQWLLAELNLQTTIKAQFWETPNRLKLFSKQDHTLIISPANNEVVIEQVKPRVLLRAANFLHLNEARKAWTYFSDAYAVMLIFLSLSALFMVKGKYGPLGKRGLLIIAGIAIPIGFVVMYSS